MSNTLHWTRKGEHPQAPRKSPFPALPIPIGRATNWVQRPHSAKRRRDVEVYVSGLGNAGGVIALSLREAGTGQTALVEFNPHDALEVSLILIAAVLCGRPRQYDAKVALHSDILDAILYRVTKTREMSGVPEPLSGCVGHREGP